MEKVMERKSNQVLVRLPEEILERLDAEATKEKRSRNAQVAFLLERYYSDEKQQTAKAA